MINWKEIHLDFTEELQKEWENKGFSYEEVKRWISTGLKVNDANYVKWLKDVRKVSSDWVLNNNSENEELKERYKNYGLCPECNQPCTESSRMSEGWCSPCIAQHFWKNFKNWTSGKLEIDQVIQRFQLEATNNLQVLEWIPYERLEIEEDKKGNNKTLGEGGFGTVYKGLWKDGMIWNWDVKNNKWIRYYDTLNHPQNVALKVLHDSQDISSDFLQEVVNYKLIVDNTWRLNTIDCYGISQDPKTKNYLMVMEYVKGGNLRQYLKNNQPNFNDRFTQLWSIASGLKEVHDQKLVHKDFHPGNILIDYVCYITDLGLCRPANSKKSDGTVYGILPYVAPEVLQGDPYTQASDIYSFGIVAYELLANSYPYYDQKDLNWERILKGGLRPNLNDIKIPSLLKDLIKRCWSINPEKRPTAEELEKTITGWKSKESLEFTSQLRERELEYNRLLQTVPYRISLSATTHSQPINTAEIARLFQESEEQAIKVEISKIEKEINKSFTDKEKELVKEFIQNKKKLLKDEENDELMDNVGELKTKLKEESFSREDMGKVIEYCERFIKSEQELDQDQLQVQVEIPTTNK